MNLTLIFVRPTSVPGGTDASEWRSREHYIGYRFTPKFGLYAGPMDKVFGIKVIEHIAFSRVSPQVAQNDQTHGVTAHYIGESWELGAQGFVVNLTQNEDLRMKGGSFTFEKTTFTIFISMAAFSMVRAELKTMIKI